MKPNNHDTIWKRCRKNDSRAQMAFYERWNGSIFNTCFRILGEQTEAENAMQDAFLSLFQNAERYDVTEKEAELLLRRTAVNRAIDLGRQRKMTFVENISDLPEVSDEEPGDLEMTAWRAEVIREMMTRLPDGYRTVLSLRLLEEMNFDEIADTIGIGTSTVRSQYVRGKEYLIKMIRKYYGTTF